MSVDRREDATAACHGVTGTSTRSAEHDNQEIMHESVITPTRGARTTGSSSGGGVPLLSSSNLSPPLVSAAHVDPSLSSSTSLFTLCILCVQFAVFFETTVVVSQTSKEITTSSTLRLFSPRLPLSQILPAPPPSDSTSSTALFLTLYQIQKAQCTQLQSEQQPPSLQAMVHFLPAETLQSTSHLQWGLEILFFEGVE
ncbi:unnamed protein product [Pleuronectes platessa]|uniref:Uncharacterized protein n=1 Tax=Pleuronectes platessa TaxID=8262 RepID=A0A9N7TVQ3_PLEPL|nr:unnamed protein product [Pleuronectes platessa]